MYWNEDGEIYDTNGNWNKVKGIQFIDNNDGPFGSFQRKSNVEIYKKDENYDLLNIGKYRFHIKFWYKSNENGDILKKGRSLEIWIKDSNAGGYTLYISGISMLIFIIREFHNELKMAKNNKWYKDRIKESLQTKEWQKNDWWRRVANFYKNQYVKLFGF